MKEITHRVELLPGFTHTDPVLQVEGVARTCYQSEPKNGNHRASEDFIRRLIRNGHTAMIEFASVGFRIVTDRGVTHELVRHRIASFAQESTRYCNYGGKDMEFVKPVTLQKTVDGTDGGPWTDAYSAWRRAMHQAEANYNEMLEAGCSPQIARSVLPNSLKTEICVQLNMRSLRNFVALRTAKTAHPDMQFVANLCVNLLRNTYHFVFIEDLVD